MKLHHIFGAACVLGGTLALSSCEKYDELFPAQYHCVLNIKMQASVTQNYILPRQKEPLRFPS